jgi:hypothetical protein
MISKAWNLAGTGSRRAIVLSCYVAAILLANGARADDWIFRPSFYSHQPNPALEAIAPRPLSRSAYRLPVIGMNPGFAIRGGYRYNRMAIQSGNSYDVTIFRNDWLEVTP